MHEDEAQSLRDGKKAIQAERKEYKSDGKVTKEERKDLHQDLNKQSKAIYDEKHGSETRATSGKSTTPPPASE